MRHLLILLFFISLSNVAKAQTNTVPRPKVGLVLSGGGAKGIAHIPLLKLIDSLGIKVDYVTGTSMGSVVGGLYAVGYKGAEIEELVRNINWDVLLSNKMYLNAINIEEKDEFGMYQMELPTTNDFRPKLPLGIIEGQGLLEFLTQLTFHVSGINNFDSLPIPFRCMTADIISGEPVLMKEGFLPLAMRSSMAIPTVFTPIDFDTMLLVDGGLVKNFPVEQALDMGADFIIGGYTGGQLYTKEQLNSFLKLLYQTSSFARLEDSENQKKLCNIYVNSNDELDGYSAGDFNKYEEILAKGEIAARLQLPLLIELANAQKPYALEPVNVNKNVGAVRIDKVFFKGNKNYKHLATGKFNIRGGDTCTAKDLKDATDDVFGTRFFNKIHFEIQKKDNENLLIVDAEETPPGAIKVGVHYDNYQHAGVLLNYTVRNLLGRSSRLLATVDFAQNPKVRLSYYKFLDNEMRYSIYSEFLFENTDLVTYNLGKRNSIFVNNYMRYNLFLRYSRNKSSMFYAGPQIETDRFYPFKDPLESSNNAELELVNYKMNRWSYHLGYKSNTLDLPFFARKGTKWEIGLKLIPNMSASTKLLFTTFDTSYQADLNYQFQPVLKFQYKLEDYRSLFHRHTLIQTVFTGVTLMSGRDDNDPTASAMYEAEKFWMGGQVNRPRAYFLPLVGFSEYEYTMSQLFVYQVEWRWNFWKNFYITPAANAILAGNSLNGFINSFDQLAFDYSNLNNDLACFDIGYGARLSLETRLGPIFVAASNSVASQNMRYAWGFGYRLQ